MGEMTSEGANAGAGIDLSQFYQVFFEEAGENLDRMEQLLLEIDIEAADDEDLNSIFRCAHSVKGGAATFGFADVAELTHQMETLLDKLRRHELQPTAPMVDVLLSAGDALRAQLARHQGSGGDAPDTSLVLADIRALVAGQEAPTRAAAAAPAVVVPGSGHRPSARARHASAIDSTDAQRTGGARPRTACRPARAAGAGRQPDRALQGDHRPGPDRGHRWRSGKRGHPALPHHHHQFRQRPDGSVHFPRAARGRCTAAHQQRLWLS